MRLAERALHCAWSLCLNTLLGVAPRSGRFSGRHFLYAWMFASELETVCKAACLELKFIVHLAPEK